jgi:integrase
MAVYKQKNSKNWWYQFIWDGKRIRESTKQTVKRVAEQMEAAHKATLAKGEVGIREKKPIPVLKDFVETDFLPFVDSRFLNKPKTLEYYRNGVKSLLSFDPIAASTLDSISTAQVTGFISKRRKAKLKVSSINRELEVLRRILRLAFEWGHLDKPGLRVQMLPGENERDRVLTAEEESRYLKATAAVGDGILAAYARALDGLRAQLRGEVPTEPNDPFLLWDVTTILLDCGLRPEESFRLRWQYVHEDVLHIPFGKTENARRRIPLTQRAAALLSMRRCTHSEEWVFPAPTRTGHIEKSSLRKQHRKAIALAKLEPFNLYTLRHTCLTRWAAYMDPYTLAYLAGHSDFSTTKRYVHPQADTVRSAMERAHEARGSHSFDHSREKGPRDANGSGDPKGFDLKEINWSGREDSNLRPPGSEQGDPHVPDCFDRVIRDIAAEFFSDR